MKKKQFIILTIGIIVLIFVTFALQNFFRDQTKTFGTSSGMFFISTFPLVEYKNALKPTENFGSINRTKKYYEKKGELGKYQNLCKNLFLITIGLALLILIFGIGEVFIIYMKS